MARILLLCWRDSTHPQGGGSERYLEHIATALAREGHDVIFRTSRSPRSPRREQREGYQLSRGGGRFGVYPRALFAITAARMGLGPLRSMRTPDVVIDTQNGVPFFARLVCGAPVVVLVHHVHREQWPVAGPLVSRLGWWIESRLAPRVHADCQYVTVSEPSAQELAGLGVDDYRIAVVRNGLDPLPAEVTAPSTTGRSTTPRLVVLSRLVPHKHVEDALEVVAALRARFPGLALDVIGGGWWSDPLRTHAVDLDLSQNTPREDPMESGAEVVFHGHVDEVTKHRILARSWVHLMPSRKEGWGLAVSEAAQHEVPTIGYHHAGGLRDSIADGESGLLVSNVEEMTESCAHLLADRALRDQLGRAASERASTLSWPRTGRAMAGVLAAVQRGDRISGDAPDPGLDGESSPQ